MVAFTGNFMEAMAIACLALYTGKSLSQSLFPRKRVFVSGCFDLLHSGHVAFFKEASELGAQVLTHGPQPRSTF